MEYADDTVFIAGTHETLSRLLHLLQHLAARAGLLLNGSKCQLVIHGSLPVSLSLSLSLSAIVHTVPQSFRFHLGKTLFVLPLSHCKALSISFPTLLLLHFPYQILTFDVPRHPLPSKLWIRFSDILLFPKKNQTTGLHTNRSGCSPPWFRIPSILSTTNHQNWQFTLQSSQTNIQDQESILP